MPTCPIPVPPHFSGIRFIGDVHGELTTFTAALEDALAKNLYVVQLGDLVDRGPDSAGCLRRAMALRESGDGIFIIGNHDEKMIRAMKPSSEVKVGEQLGRTLASIDAQPAPFRDAVLAALKNAPAWLNFGRYFAVHGGFDPMMLEYESLDAMPTRRLAKRLLNRAIRGQTPDVAPGEQQAVDEDGYPVRVYDWIDEVPAELTVVIGHDAISNDSIIERIGTLGGRVLFCDTGCGKGGKLSWVDVPREQLSLS